MTHQEIVITVIIGGVFVLLGIVGFFWSRKEENEYYGSITEHQDVRSLMRSGPEQRSVSPLVLFCYL